jgi:hypothetical protein
VGGLPSAGQLGHHVPGDQFTRQQAKAVVNALQDLVEVLAEAEPHDKMELYDHLGISLAASPPEPSPSSPDPVG